MGFLKRLFGGGAPPEAAVDEPAPSQQELDEAERAYERELADFESHRLDDLRDRQLRYADRAWTPPAQGGERRSDDSDETPDS
jgi:hypothetical protein